MNWPPQLWDTVKVFHEKKSKRFYEAFERKFNLIAKCGCMNETMLKKGDKRAKSSMKPQSKCRGSDLAAIMISNIT